MKTIADLKKLLEQKAVWIGLCGATEEWQTRWDKKMERMRREITAHHCIGVELLRRLRDDTPLGPEGDEIYEELRAMLDE